MTMPIALQLYAVREECAKDFPGTLSAVAEMGYTGVERAWRAGLRIFVTDLVDNEQLCQEMTVRHLPCNDMSAVHVQSKDLYALQSYGEAVYVYQ